MKLLSALIGTLALVAAALVAAPGAANAAYPGTVATSCTYGTPHSVRKGHAYRVLYNVRASGNATPSGKVTFRVYHVGKHGGLSFNRSFSNGYTGPSTRVKSLGKFHKRGRYVTQLVFRPNSGSVYKSCASGFHSFRVKHR